MSARGPYAKGIARRQEILDVALEVIARTGCRNATNKMIAETVGLSQAGLMHYFGSREDLYLEILRARDERDAAAFCAPGSGIDGFIAVIAHNAQVPGLVQLYVEFSAEATIPGHPAQGFFAERLAWLRRLLLAELRDHRARGELGPHGDLAVAADLLIAAADGAQQQWLLDPSRDMAALLRAQWRLIRAGSWQEGKE